MFKTFLLLLVSLVISTACAAPRSDYYLKSRSVRLMGEEGMCSGEQVRAPSGKDYILSASHCKGLANSEGVVRVITETGAVVYKKIIAEDATSDLLLLEGIVNMEGLHMAKSIFMGEKIRTFTHGHNRDTYETSGMLVAEVQFSLPIRPILTDVDTKDCTGVKYQRVSVGGQGIMCVMTVTEIITTAKIVPGSSGGMIVDSAGDIVGVASATDGAEMFGDIVPLSYIQNFLSNY